MASSSMRAYDITETVDKSTISEANGTRLQGFIFGGSLGPYFELF